MPRGKKIKAEDIIPKLRQIEILSARGDSIEEACRQVSITVQSYYRWKKEYGGLEVNQAKRLKDLEQENSRLKRIVADQALDNAMLKDLASGKF